MFSVCGDNLIVGNEICDGTDLGGETCHSQGFTTGTLSCAADCGYFVTSDCDTDEDQVADGEDNCINDPNPHQDDADNDGVGDVCDPCFGDNTAGDSDGDGYCDDVDNCINDYNPDQADTDGDGFGDACDDTFDGKSDASEERFCCRLISFFPFPLTLLLLSLFQISKLSILRQRCCQSRLGGNPWDVWARCRRKY